MANTYTFFERTRGSDHDSAADWNQINRNAAAIINTSGTAAPDFTIKSLRLSSAKSADYTVTDNDGIDTIRMTTGGSNRTITLPTATDNADRIITCLKVDSGAGTMIIDGEGAETLDYLSVQQVTITAELEGSGLIVKCNGTSWNVVGVLGAEIYDISGVLEVIYTKYFTGTTDADSQTNVTHGVTGANIVAADGAIQSSSSSFWSVCDYKSSAVANELFTFAFDATLIVFGDVGSNYQSQNYKAVIKHFV